MIKIAERRMFAKKITESDAFLDMPSSSQSLYFHLNMSADDDGFVNNPKKIQRMVGAADDDLKLLIAKKFIIVFESGIIVIKHWKMHNYIQSDRYRSTDYLEEKSLLEIKDNKSYTVNVSNVDTNCIQDVRVGKVSIGKVSLEVDKDITGDKPQTTKFIPPSIEQVQEYCKERNNTINAEKFIDHYETSNWFRGKTKIKSWKACIRTWEEKEKEKPTTTYSKPQQSSNPFMDRLKKMGEMQDE